MRRQYVQYDETVTVNRIYEGRYHRQTRPNQSARNHIPISLINASMFTELKFCRNLFKPLSPRNPPPKLQPELQLFSIETFIIYTYYYNLYFVIKGWANPEFVRDGLVYHSRNFRFLFRCVTNTRKLKRTRNQSLTSTVWVSKTQFLA